MIPEAPVVLDGRQWVVTSCPFCSKEHRHGAGGKGADPLTYLGYREAHCGPSRGQYKLVQRAA